MTSEPRSAEEIAWEAMASCHHTVAGACGACVTVALQAAVKGAIERERERTRKAVVQAMIAVKSALDDGPRPPTRARLRSALNRLTDLSGSRSNTITQVVQEQHESAAAIRAALSGKEADAE